MVTYHFFFPFFFSSFELTNNFLQFCKINIQQFSVQNKKQSLETWISEIDIYRLSWYYKELLGIYKVQPPIFISNFKLKGLIAADMLKF